MAGKSFGICAIFPAVMLLAVSFFVMVVLQKIQEGALKSFGRIVAAFLCISAVLVFAIGMYTLSMGACPIMKKIGKCGAQKTGYYQHPWSKKGMKCTVVK
jgi:hypothetical protein